MQDFAVVAERSVKLDGLILLKCPVLLHCDLRITLLQRLPARVPRFVLLLANPLFVTRDSWLNS